MKYKCIEGNRAKSRTLENDCFQKLETTNWKIKENENDRRVRVKIMRQDRHKKGDWKNLVENFKLMYW